MLIARSKDNDEVAKLERQFERLVDLSRNCGDDRDRAEHADAAYEDAPLYESFSDDSRVPLFHEYPLLSVPEHCAQRYDGRDDVRIDSQKYGRWRTGVKYCLPHVLPRYDRSPNTVSVEPTYGRFIPRPTPSVRPYRMSGIQ